MSEHELWNELGNLYFLSGAYSQAVNAYQRSIQLEAGFGRPYSNLALTYVQQGRYQEAIELYRRSIELLVDDEERAISWNRLGGVYRHLKDYPQAVVAFQHADELDPRSINDYPLISPAPHESAEEPAPDVAPDHAPAEQKDPDPQPEVDWWDMDENHGALLVPFEADEEISEEELNASWTSADLTDVQQDLSQVPEAGSLTTWGDSEPEEEFEVYPPAAPETEVGLPEPDEGMSTWLPLPEEAPPDLDRLQVPPFFEEPAAPALVNLPTQNESPAYHVLDSVDYVPLLSPGPVDLPERREAAPGAQPSWAAADVDVAVEDRPVAEVAIAAPEAPEPAMPAPVELEAQLEAQPEPAPLPEPEPEPAADAAATERDPEELQEIEMGIAKFRRVVQLNPRNAHAWDALGTLFKSAGLYKDAILAYQQAISNDSSKSMYYHHLGLVYACEGRDEDAIDAFQRVIEIDPEYSLAHATLGGYYRKMGLQELAQKHIGKAMKNIFDSENEYNRACLEAICGNADQAIELLGVALKNKQTYVDWILRDPDLDFIRQDPRFKQLISDYTK